MGQYYKVVNITKKETIHPHAFNDGAKLMEFGLSGCGMMAGLALLLADGNGRGVGDFRGDDAHGIVGRWAGDQIVITGDYADVGKFTQDLKVTLYEEAEGYEDISNIVFETLKEDL